MQSAQSALLIPEEFGFFNPQVDYSVTYGNLPHWEQVGATQFITFRTADSIPRGVMDLWVAERDQWLHARGIDPNRPGWGKRFARLPFATQRTFHREFTVKMERCLDELHGTCLLARPGMAEIVAASLRHFNRARYHLGDFVVMPNHVHLIVCFLKGFRLRTQCNSWKRFTARQINRALGRTGQFWQTESFDHLIRDGQHFARFQRYIRGNAEQAKQRGADCVHWEMSL